MGQIKILNSLASLLRLQALQRALKHEEGATLVEIAISFTLFAAVLLGVMQMSLALYAYHFVSDAAREASRWAMVRGSACRANVSTGTAYCSPTSGLSGGADNGDIQAYVRSLGYPFASSLTTNSTWCLPNSGTPQTWTSCSTVPAGYNGAGSQVQVTVTYNFPIGIPGWSGTSIPVASTSSMVISQ